MVFTSIYAVVLNYLMSASIAARVPAKVAHGISVALVLSVAEVVLKYSELGRTESS